ncbi:hypothetical protein NDN08_005396 [Rhodosorus marinus]|uniref:DUF5117 domain-containing protein n=1 Tax=Rhodosorus marinus TaxID=101924 RepID=A0AAV8V1I1_9RHOD|nr:hypothetical protein NDN08_005396 [Rhodosorus marinus]
MNVRTALTAEDSDSSESELEDPLFRGSVRQRLTAMLGSRKWSFFSALVAGIIAGCLVLLLPGRPTSAPITHAKNSLEPPTIDTSLLEFEESVFPVFYSDFLQPTVMLDIPEESLGKPFIIGAIFSKGDSEVVVAHMSASADESNVFAFKLSDGLGFTMDVYRPQYSVRIDDDSGLKDAYDLGVYEGFESSFQYFKSAQTGGYVIDIAPWVAELFGLFGELDSELTESRISGVSVFPMNLNVEVKSQLPATDDKAPDVEVLVPVDIQFTIMMLPDKPMEARYADERLGFFTIPYVSLDGRDPGTGKKEMVTRRRLERKREAGGKITDVKGQIIYYIDESVPENLRAAMKKGVENWQKAFEAAGFKDAIKAVVPSDPDFPDDFDAGDARFSSISWSADLDETFAIAPADVDPRTGEILRANIVFTHGWLNTWTQRYWLLRNGKVPGFRIRPRLNSRLSFQRVIAEEHMNRISLMAAAFARQSYESVEDLVLDGVTDVTMHEVGHTLGLRHNFRGSANYNWNDLKNKTFVSEHGISSSIMDYLPMIIMADEKEQNYFFSPCVGDYDVEAIKYGYMDADEGTLDEIARLAVDRGLHFATDEDEPGLKGGDPYVSTYDAGANPMDYHENMEKLVTKRLGLLSEEAASQDLPWSDFTIVFREIVHRLQLSLSLAAKFVGGVETTRERANTDSIPIKPIPEDKQLRALDFILRIIDPFDGLFGVKSFSKYQEFFVKMDGEDCDSPVRACLALKPVDSSKLAKAARSDPLNGLLDPSRISRLSLHGGMSLSHVVQNVTNVFFKSTKSFSDDVAAFVGGARVQWLDLLQSHAEDIDTPPLASAIFAAELGRARNLALALVKEEGPLAKSILVGMCKKTELYSSETSR